MGVNEWVSVCEKVVSVFLGLSSNAFPLSPPPQILAVLYALILCGCVHKAHGEYTTV